MNKIPLINQIIKDKRKSLKLNQTDFAKLINKSPTTVKRYDTGDIIPQNTLLLICDKLGLDILQLVISQKRENFTNDTNFYIDLIKKYNNTIPVEVEFKKDELLNKLMNVFSEFYSFKKNTGGFQGHILNDKYYIRDFDGKTLAIFTKSQASELINHFKDYIDYFIFKCQKENLNK